MSDNNTEQLRDLTYPALEEIVIPNFESTENIISEEPIYFDPSILCCPYCGNQDLKIGGLTSEKKNRYICKNKNCGTQFTDPKQRVTYPVKKRNAKKDLKYFDPNTLCCPKCGGEQFKKAGFNRGKRQYKCKNEKCKTRFLDPVLRTLSIKVEGVLCRFCNSDNYYKSGLTYLGKQKYICKDCKRIFTPEATRNKPKTLPISDDVWNVADLGVKVLGTGSRKKFNFTNIHQPWFKELVKKFVKFAAFRGRANETIQGYITNLNTFSDFLDKHYPEITSISEIDRELIIDYGSYVNKLNYTNTTANNKMGSLQTFIQIGNVNKWFATNSYLFLEEDRLRQTEIKPRYIPEYVLKQLDKHKYKLPTPVKTMISVMRETGVRYSTLATIPFDCLELDSSNKWWIKFCRVKIPKETRLPITEQLAQEIKEQQNFLKQHFKKNKYLFTARKKGSYGDIFIPQHNKLMLLGSFFLYLNKLSRECKITDENGEIYIITSHQFRHTFGTEAINNGVPQHIVQELLGHESPQMTSVYAHIHDETLRKELDKFHKNRTIDITGQIVELEFYCNSQDLQWFTKEISAIALPSGYCGRPKMLGDCDIAGDVGCYICPHFRTSKTFLDIHKDQLERINKVLDKAHRYNWQLPIKKNEPIKTNLELIISVLEANNNE